MIILEILGFVALVVIGVLSVGYFKARNENPIVFEEIKPVKMVKVAPKKTTKTTAKKTTKPAAKKTVKKTSKK